MTRSSFLNARMLALALAMSSLAGCGNGPVHRQESFNPASPFHYRIPAQVDDACQAARLALLSQGYIAEIPAPNQIKANKSFQPEDDSHVVIDFNVVCAGTRNGTTLYANAQENRYDLKKTSKSAELNIASVGGISLPWGSSSEALVKVSGHTIDEPGFYKRFYELIDRQLGIGR